MNRDRFIVIITIIIVVVIGAILLTREQRMPTPQPQPATEDAAMKAAVIGLYSSYEDCMTNPPTEAEGQVGNYCQAHNQHASSAFVANLAKGGTAAAGGDPITCSQNPPTSIKVTSVDQSANSAEVTENFGGEINTTIHVSLIQEHGTWKVDNIICPAP